MTYKEHWEKLCKEQNDLATKYRETKDNCSSKEYQDMLYGLIRISRQKKNLYKNYKFEQYNECNHICGKVYETDDYYTSRSYHKCLKCGLDETVLLGVKSFLLPSYTEIEASVMHEYLYDKSNPIQGVGIHSGEKLYIDYDELKKVYDELIKEKPDSTDYDFLVKCVEKLGISESYIDIFTSRSRKKSEETN